MFEFFNIIMYIAPIISIGIFIFVVFIIFSPKAKGKFMSNHIKATKYMMDESEDAIRDISTSMADATKDGIQITARAIKNGFVEEETIYCKHCGTKIDADSKFCKKCGKEQ